VVPEVNTKKMVCLVPLMPVICDGMSLVPALISVQEHTCTMKAWLVWKLLFPWMFMYLVVSVSKLGRVTGVWRSESISALQLSGDNKKWSSNHWQQWFLVVTTRNGQVTMMVWGDKGAWVTWHDELHSDHVHNLVLFSSTHIIQKCFLLSILPCCSRCDADYETSYCIQWLKIGGFVHMWQHRQWSQA
jgi:hypothetical protein